MFMQLEDFKTKMSLIIESRFICCSLWKKTLLLCFTY